MRRREHFGSSHGIEVVDPAVLPQSGKRRTRSWGHGQTRLCRSSHLCDTSEELDGYFQWAEIIKAFGTKLLD